jgi:hypothetical protein
MIVIPLEGNLYTNMQLFEGGSGRNGERTKNLIFLPPAINELESNFEEVDFWINVVGKRKAGD